MMTIPKLAILMLVVSAADHDDGHLILDAGLLGGQASLQKKLDDASLAGYNVVAGFERVVIMRRAHADPIGEFDADAIDEGLESMAAAGYRPLALATRVVDDLLKRPHRQLIVFFEKLPGAPVTTNVRGAARRYHVVIAHTETELERRLNEAGAAGFHLLAMVSAASPEIVAIVEKLPTTAQRSYRVLASRTVSKLSEEFARAAAAGWAPHPSGVLDPSRGYRRGYAVLLVVERDETRAAGEVFVLRAKRSSTLAKELNQETVAGFELLTGGRSRGELVLLLRRPAARSRSTAQGARGCLRCFCAELYAAFGLVSAADDMHRAGRGIQAQIARSHPCRTQDLRTHGP